MQGVEIYAPREAHHRRTWTLAAIALSLVFIIAGAILGTLVYTAVPWLSWTGLPRLAAENSGALLFQFAPMAILLALWVILYERRGLSTVGFTGLPFLPFLRGLAWGLVSLAAVVLIVAALGGYTIEASGQLGAPNFATLWPFIVFAGAFIVQGSTEEFIMRGWLMQLTASRHGVTAGIVISTIVFSALHGSNIKPSDELILGLLNIVLVGVFLGLYAAQEGSIWGVCGWHAAWNWLLGLGFGLEVSGMDLGTKALVIDLKSEAAMPWWITGGAFGPEGSLIATGVLLTGCLWLLFKGPKVT